MNLDRLGRSYLELFWHHGTLSDLERAIECLTQGVELATTDDSDMAARLDHLGVAYDEQFRHLGDLKDLDKSIEYYSRALALIPDEHPDISRRLANLGMSYSDRFRRLDGLEDLEKSIECDSRALVLTPDGHPDMPERLASLGVSYSDRFMRLGHLEDLEKLIECDSRALELTPNEHPDRPDRLANLGASYGDRFRRLGRLEDLEKSIDYRSRALELTQDGHLDMSYRLAGLGASYTDRFRRLGHLTDLDKSIEYKSRSLALTPDGHSDMSRRLADLGVSYGDRFHRLGHLEDLEKSIEYDFRALALTPDQHPDMPRRLGNLGLSYTDRFERLGHLEDLEKSIGYKSRALALTPDEHPDMPERLGNLGMSYTDRFKRLGHLEDLEKSIGYKSRALALTPDGHPDMAHWLASLGLSYTDRFRRLGRATYLEKSIDYYSRALALTPDGHPDMPRWLAGLGAAYTDLFEHLGHLEDLEKSIEYGSRTLALTPEGHPDLPERYFNYGLSSLSRYEHTGNVSDLDHSFNSFRTASQLSTGAPRDRFQFALQWAEHASHYAHLDTIEAYRTTVELLPQFIWLGATTHQQYRDLSTAQTLAVDAAFAAIQASDYSLALEWLEHARCVVWNQSLMLRSPLDQLYSSHPDLAAQLKAIATQLHGSSFETQVPSFTLQQIGQRLPLANRYQALLAQVRQLPGFEKFLQPVKANKLIRAARNGPVVAINCHANRCDALFIIPGHESVRHLPLPKFTEKKARQARSDLDASLRHLKLRERGVRPRRQPGYKDRIGSVLLTLWSDVVKPVLDYLGYLGDRSRESLPHIIWCPTGTLSFLPLHAAGNYAQSRSRIFDYVVSSYTPTVTSLLVSTPNSLDQDRPLLAIGQARTPGRNPLPGTLKELAHVKAHTHSKAQYSQLIDDEATTTSVLDAMEHHDWVHFACHAHQNVTDPTKSGFYLHDGILDLASINRRSFKNKGLAFLSACQTATGDEKLPDEAIHLASGMLMAGYPSVIATMWSVVDDDAPLVADKVYGRLMKDGKVGNGEAGRALHDAVAALREKVGEEAFGRWVPYIHIGS